MKVAEIGKTNIKVDLIGKTIDFCSLRESPDNNVSLSTFEDNSLKNKSDDLFIMGGRLAGTCYGPGTYFNKGMVNSEKARFRADLITKSGHHSPWDAAYISMYIHNIPKILAMLLNSTEFYATSEKSARYTTFTPANDVEDRLYKKWIDKFKDIISKSEYSEMGVSIDKLALENARYCLSVFTPSTYMGYATTYRQLNYMVGWLQELADKLTNKPNKFNNMLLPYVIDLRSEFLKIVDGRIKDNKSRGFEFLKVQCTDNYTPNTDDDYEIFTDVYRTNYLVSFVSLAQLHRHRTIHYEMEFSGDKPGEYGFYVPEILVGTELEKEWLEDIGSVADNFPNATLVKVTEEGRASWFFNKCKERLCGRAQLETMRNVESVMKKFINNYDKLSSHAKSQLQGMVKIDDKTLKIVPCARCQFKDFNCTEPCVFGAKHGLDRRI